MEVLKPPWKLNHFIMHISCNHIWQWIGQIIRYHDIPKESHFWIGSHYALLAKAKIHYLQKRPSKFDRFPRNAMLIFNESKVEIHFWWFSNHCVLNKYSLMEAVALKVSYFLICHCTCVATSRREQKRATSVWREESTSRKKATALNEMVMTRRFSQSQVIRRKVKRR